MYDEVPNLPFLRPLDFENYKNSKFTGKASLALITNSSGQLLLNLRDDNPKIAHPNVWAFIGGVCEEGENDYDALVREVREEIELEIGLELPNTFEKYDISIQESIIKYLKQLSIIEKKAYSIGKEHLGTSFNVIKSNGYLNWQKNNK